MVAGFVASFIDSTVGGGGLISTPAILSTGMPVPWALGTNKVGASIGAITSFLTFWRAGKIKKRLVLCLMPLSFVGAICGAYAVHLLPQGMMKTIIVVMLVLVAVYTYLRKDWGDLPSKEQLTGTMLGLSALMALVMGFYDGFFGPGTGSFLIFGFLFLGFDFVTAAGNAKALNMASNLGALITFALAGTVNWYYGLGMGFTMILGSLLGARMAIIKGASYVRPLYLTVTMILIGKQVFDLLK